MDFYARHGMQFGPNQVMHLNNNTGPSTMELPTIEPKMLFDLVFLSVMSIALCCSSAYVGFKVLAAHQATGLHRVMCLLMSLLDLIGGAVVLFAANLHFSDRQRIPPVTTRCGLWIAINVIFLSSSGLCLVHLAASWGLIRQGGPIYGNWMADRKAQTLMSWTVLASTFYLYSDLKASGTEFTPIC